MFTFVILLLGLFLMGGSYKDNNNIQENYKVKELRMKIPQRSYVLLLILILSTQLIIAKDNANDLPGGTNAASVPFIKNIGQQNEKVSFYAQTFGGTVFISYEGEIIYSLPKGLNETAENAKSNVRSSGISLREFFRNGSPETPVGCEEAITKVNHFRGSDVDQWKSNIPTFESVSLGEVFEGIEVKLRAYGKNVEKLFYVSPESDYKLIGVSFEGANSLNVNSEGELEVETALGIVAFTRPIAYQEYESGRKLVDVAYRVDGINYTFEVGEYDQNKTLIIDPLLASTFVGGNGTDEDYESLIAIDNEGNIFFSGSVSSSNYPSTAGAYDQSFNGTSDRVISKFSPDLSTLLVSTFIGGTYNEYGMGLCFDDNNNIYLAGYTQSNNFPTTSGAYDRTFNGNLDAFVIMMDNNLSTLIASTYFGGSGNEGEQFPRIDIALGNTGDVYITGITQSTNLPTLANSFDNELSGGLDLFVAKFNADLSSLLGSTYLGGYTDEYRPSILIDSNENVFIGGSSGAGFPTTVGAYQRTHNSTYYDMVIAKLSSDLSILIASTNLGGGYSQDLLGMKFDSEQNLYVCGYTFGAGYPTSETAFDKTFNSTYPYTQDACITLMSNDLSTLLASTLFGGSLLDRAEDIALDTEGNVYIIGTVASTNLPMQDYSYSRTISGMKDAFVAKFDPQLENLIASTYLGSTGEEEGKCIVIDANNNIFVSGQTESTTFPTTPGAFDESYNGGTTDCFIAKFDSTLSNIINGFEDTELPNDFRLEQNYPNPFNPTTTISFTLSNSSHIELRVYDSLGRLINTLVNDHLSVGSHSLVWNGKDSRGSDVVSGIYFCELKTDHFHNMIKMNLVK